MTDKINRQHSETEISEIVGDSVDKMLAVKGASKDTIVLLYVLLRGLWLRLFLDEGVLFADICDEPDVDDDLEEGDEYLDLTAVYDLCGQVVSKASMKRGVFQLSFKSGVEMLFEQDGEETKFRKLE